MLCCMGHTLMENRNGLVVQADLTRADGHAERRAVWCIATPPARPAVARWAPTRPTTAPTSSPICADLRKARLTPHVAQKARHSAIDGRTTRHAGYALSQRHRKRIEEPFGWAKTVGGTTQTMLRGLDRVGGRCILTMAAANLAKLPRLLPA